MGVSLHHQRDFEGRDSPEPFIVVITTDDDAAFATRNAAAIEKAAAIGEHSR